MGSSGKKVRLLPEFHLCFPSPSAAAFLTRSLTKMVVAKISKHGYFKCEKPAKERRHMRKLLGILAILCFLTQWVLTWIFS